MSQKIKSKAYDIMLSTFLNHDVNEMGVKEAAHHEEAVFVDSRQREEYEVSHIPGAIWVGFENPQFDALSGTAKSKTIIIYCSIGYRSEKIALKLKQMGFEHIYNLYGGIFEWVNQGYEVEDMQANTTKKVHAYNHLWGFWLDRGTRVY